MYTLNKTLQILVIDDDPIFRQLIAKAAESAQISITVASSLKEVSPMTVPQLFDVVVMDYFLDDIQRNLTGTELAHVLEATPVLLTSSSEHAVEHGGAWPTSIRKFVSKKYGVANILQQALELAR